MDWISPFCFAIFLILCYSEDRNDMIPSCSKEDDML